MLKNFPLPSVKLRTLRIRRKNRDLQLSRLNRNTSYCALGNCFKSRYQIGEEWSSKCHFLNEKTHQMTMNIHSLKNANSSRRRSSSIRLTPRELEILTSISHGLSSYQISEMLFISKRTVDFHRANIYEKFQVKNRVMAIRAASSHGFLPMEPSRLI